MKTANDIRIAAENSDIQKKADELVVKYTEEFYTAAKKTGVLNISVNIHKYNEQNNRIELHNKMLMDLLVKKFKSLGYKASYTEDFKNSVFNLMLSAFSDCDSNEYKIYQDMNELT